jgi:hypothetical protein
MTRRAAIRIIGAAMLPAMLSCLETAAPTPKPTLVSITLLAKGSLITNTDGTKRFLMRLRVARMGDTVVYAGYSYELEKLVNQKWERAAVREFLQPGAFILVPRLGGVDYAVGVAYTEGLSEHSELLAHMRGLYRARLHLYYAPDDGRPLPADAGVSPPFAVTE